MDRGIQSVVEAAAAGDAIITLGAGSVSQAGEKILEKLR
jgi:UDP-N-acetylmuramate--alanine ligase